MITLTTSAHCNSLRSPSRLEQMPRLACHRPQISCDDGDVFDNRFGLPLAPLVLRCPRSLLQETCARAPRHASGRRAALHTRHAEPRGRHGRGPGPAGHHRPLSGPRGAFWRALCPLTRHARFQVLGALRPVPSCATRAPLCGAWSHGLVSARSRRYSSRGLEPRSTARARGASAAPCARGACGGTARHSRADNARARGWHRAQWYKSLSAAGKRLPRARPRPLLGARGP